MSSSHYNNLTNNTATSNNYDGIFLDNSDHNRLISNTATGHKPLDGSFEVLILNGGDWEQQGELSFYNYETRQLPLTHDAGTFTLRLSQHGHDAAYVDYVALKKDDTLYLPTSALNMDSTANIWHKIISSEYDVCDAWNSTLEIRWDNVPENTTLVMRAMEEDLGEGHGSPLYYPLLREGRTLTHTLVDDGGMTVDGLLEENGEPDFSVFWRPDSPHPDGYTYGWLHSDNQYLYAAVEITADNTPDEEDWGALFVMVNGELREFRVSSADTTWGAPGFQYTSSVPYEHRIYEFEIPLSEINARIGDELHYGFGAYGTVSAFYSGITLGWESTNNTLSKNTVTDNENGIYLSDSSNNSISCNLVAYNDHGGFYLGAGESSTGNTIEHNNIINGDYNETSGGWEWNFHNYQSDNVTAENNYWGTATSAVIAAGIKEDTGDVDYEPFLTEPAACAPNPDDDGDGVPGVVEEGAPGGGDGNGDGIPDRTQPNVTSLPTATNQGYMTLVLSNCSQLRNVTALTDAPDDPDYNYPYGLVSFVIPCENGTVEIIYQTDLTGHTYRKYGPTTPGDAGTTAWYDFSTYATIAGNRVTLSFQDNRLGDDTGDDGKIVEPGGPGILGAAAAAAVPAMTPIGLLALIGIMSVMLARASVRKRKR
ncbi:MAG: right-handed parallel beta-helix repeat-containing protein [Methanosarcinales archaeon]|nr:right-handed parallel beta-helix repeat-containing protein [Methanosarcinales archaeon]